MNHISVKFEKDSDNPNTGKWFSRCRRFFIDDKVQVIAECEYLDGFFDADLLAGFDVDLEISEKAWQDIHMSLLECLQGDIWSPGGKQFSLTKEYQLLQKSIEKVENIRVSPDVAIEKSNGDFSWST